jgi:hypothetical protein
MSLDTDIGSATANSYCSVTEFQLYWQTKVIPSGQASPDSFGDSDVERGLMQATAELDREGYLGDVAASTQALQWPRYNAYYRSGYPVASDAIPQAVKDATCELAYALLLEPSLTEDDGLNRFTRISLGNGEVDLSPRQMATGGLPSNVTRILRDFLSGCGAKVYRA